MNCEVCGAEIPEGFKFCSECGAPVPQNKVCPSCKTEVPENMKFCFNCGYNFEKQPTDALAGVAMGDKNVVAGDVTGSKEEYNISGVATIIKNSDETKKVVTCHICGKNLTIVDTHTCPVCRQSVCNECFDNKSGMCLSCKTNNKASSENKYREALKKAYEDGKVDLEERRSLEALQSELGLSDQKANELENEIKYASKKIDSLTTVEKLNMEEASELFYDKGDVNKAYGVMQTVYIEHKYDETVLDLYLPILAEYDSAKALDIIKSLKADMLTAYLVQIDIYTKSDLSKAERILNDAEKLWPDNLLLKCRKVIWLYNMYKETNKDAFTDEIKQIVTSLPEANTKLERTWKAKVENLSCTEDKSLDSFTENECNDKNIYNYCVNSSVSDTNKWELTEEPILLEPGTDGSAGTKGTYVLFGDWPQTIKKDDVKIDESTTYKVNEWDCYKGSDGCYYVKETANPFDDKITYSNGKNIEKDKDYYFKVESIKWRVLKKKFGGEKLLLAENALIASMFYINDSFRCSHRGGISVNNYEYSHIRAYLNGLNGFAYDIEDFTNKGFINKAFSKKAIEKINTVKVDNSASSTVNREKNEFMCNNTKDKIFLLSQREVAERSYGFAAYDKDFETRILQNTDYSLATGASSVGNRCNWWLRSPEGLDAFFVCGVNYSGDASHGCNAYDSDRGVVPALSISF